jgi:hypothetical protein
MQKIKVVSLILTLGLVLVGIRRITEGENGLLIMGQCFFPVICCGAIILNRAFLGFVASVCGFMSLIGEILCREEVESVEICIQMFICAILILISFYSLNTSRQEKDEKEEIYGEDFSVLWV